MPASEKKITVADIIPEKEFAACRNNHRKALLPMKKLRRIAVGPFCSFYFENFDTMLFQVQEMLLIEKGGAEQLKDELAAYNPLIPKGNELVATVMFEIDDPEQRLDILGRLGGVEEHFFLDIGGEKVYGLPEGDTERSTPEGKTSSVHFVRFPIRPKLQTRFALPDMHIMLGVDNEGYAHLAIIPPASRAELIKDFCRESIASTPTES